MNAFKICEAAAFIHPVRTRMPFRFGIAEIRQIPHIFVRVTLENKGRQAIGTAADHLMPKWFTKNPQTTCREDILELMATAATACDVARSAAAEPTPFRLWWSIYHEQARRAQAKHVPPLLASFGASLIERALIDAFCRLDNVPFHAALRENRLGMDLGQIYPELHGTHPAAVLPPAPAASIKVRHTVGLGDPLLDADLTSGNSPEDDLPVSLEACIREYGITSFKIKISDHTARNIDRLEAITAVLEKSLPGSYSFTLDGNESYQSIEAFADFWESLRAAPGMRPRLEHLLFVEQPLHRSVALSPDGIGRFLSLPGAPRVIIDESDATLDTLPLALDCGYAGTTHKNCKGVFKSVANLALLQHRYGDPSQYVFSGEDLTNIGPIALLEDLCVAQSLGLDNIERNGHHYFRGLSNFPRQTWEPLLAAHADLYRQLPDGCPALRIEKGLIHGTSLHRVGLGPAFALDLDAFTPLEEWSPDSLEA